MDKREIKIFWDKGTIGLPICFCYELPEKFEKHIYGGRIFEVTCLYSGTQEEVKLLSMLHPDLELERIKSLIQQMQPIWDKLENYLANSRCSHYWPNVYIDRLGTDTVAELENYSEDI